MSRRRPNLKDRVDPRIEARVLQLAVEEPAWGQLRMSNELAKEGIVISPSGVRGIWQRHELQAMKLRLKALEAKVAQEGL